AGHLHRGSPSSRPGGSPATDPDPPGAVPGAPADPESAAAGSGLAAADPGSPAADPGAPADPESAATGSGPVAAARGSPAADPGAPVATGSGPPAAGPEATAAERRRSSHSSDGEIGIRSIRNPSASSMAEASTAAPGITPASPAPLMPSGFSGDGVSRWSISTTGTSEAYGIRKSMNEAFSSWPAPS